MEDLAKAADMNRLIQDLKLECANGYLLSHLPLLPI